MFEWIASLDFDGLLKALTISLVIILITLIVFHHMWLKNPYFRLKKTHTHFLAENFYLNMILLLYNLDNHRLWIEIVGFEGFLISLFISPFCAHVAQIADKVYILVWVLLAVGVSGESCFGIRLELAVLDSHGWRLLPDCGHVRFDIHCFEGITAVSEANSDHIYEQAK